MNLKESESINDFFKDDTKFIGEYQMLDYKVLRGYIPGFGQDLRLYYTKLDPPNKKASICIIHGFGEHQGRFLHVADFFAKMNFVVHLIDLRGFGFSGGPRGSQSIADLQLDVEVLIRQASKDLPLFLYGHAMGALVIISLLIRNPKLKISGVICTAPTLGFPLNRNIGPFKQFLIKNFGHYLEDLVINTNVNPTSLSKNNQHIQRIFEDRLVMPFLGVGMARSIYKTLPFIFKNSVQFQFPIIIFHGKQDTQSSYENSVQFINQVGSKDKQIKLFDEGYHELQHDEEFQCIKQQLNEWIKIRLENSVPFGILSQPRLLIGIPIQKNRKKLIICLLILLIIYFLTVFIKKSKFKKVQYPFVPILILYNKLIKKQLK
ncbi:unnamed protein product [Paramecium primaurelia]|uniref:Serine aminopeptidase S33 domain-containing protein n=1 Tax=Paramecium primaurelia TaxID=5886 RepID=A0A8S1JNA6_PARPR|nr:unnamed protein product [Paramecium primaurelia]